MENLPPILPSNPASQPDAEGYRLALLLTGNSAAACGILQAIFAVVPEELAQLRGKERRKIWLIRQIRSRALKWRQENPGTAEFEGNAFLPSRVSALPEPGRSAFALFHSLEGNPEEFSELLRLKPAVFAQALASARQALAPESAFPEDALLRVHRPWGGDRSRVARAVRAAQSSPEFAAQGAADTQWHEEILGIPIPEKLALLDMAACPRPGLRALIFQPAVLSIALALLVVVGVLVYMAQTRMGNFAGKDAVVALVEDTASLSRPEFEAIPPTNAGDLDDWFVLKGFEGYEVPRKLQNARAIGCRVHKHDGMLLAEVALEQKDARLLVFRAVDMKIRSDRRGWHIFQQDEWAVAARIDEERGYVVMFQGDSDEMAGFLRTVGK